MLRRHVLVLVAIAAVFHIPGSLLAATVSARLADAFTTILPVAPDGNIPVSFALDPREVEELLTAAALAFLAAALAGVVASLGTLAFARVVADDYGGRRPSFAGAVTEALRRTPVALGVMLVTTVVTVLAALAALAASAGALSLVPPTPGGGGPGVFLVLVIGVALVFGLAWVSLRWAMALQVAALESEGVLDTLRRSWHLTGGQVLRILAVLAVGGIVTAVITSVIAQLMAIVLVDPLAGDAAWLADTFVSTIAPILPAPIVPVLAAVLYHDLRVRRDGPSRTARPS